MPGWAAPACDRIPAARSQPQSRRDHIPRRVETLVVMAPTALLASSRTRRFSLRRPVGPTIGGARNDELDRDQTRPADGDHGAHNDCGVACQRGAGPPSSVESFVCGLAGAPRSSLTAGWHRSGRTRAHESPDRHARPARGHGRLGCGVRTGAARRMFRLMTNRRPRLSPPKRGRFRNGTDAVPTRDHPLDEADRLLQQDRPAAAPTRPHLIVDVAGRLEKRCTAGDTPAPARPRSMPLMQHNARPPTSIGDVLEVGCWRRPGHKEPHCQPGDFDRTSTRRALLPPVSIGKLKH